MGETLQSSQYLFKLLINIDFLIMADWGWLSPVYDLGAYVGGVVSGAGAAAGKAISPYIPSPTPAPSPTPSWGFVGGTPQENTGNLVTNGIDAYNTGYSYTVGNNKYNTSPTVTPVQIVQGAPAVRTEPVFSMQDAGAMGLPAPFRSIPEQPQQSPIQVGMRTTLSTIPGGMPLAIASDTAFSLIQGKPQQAPFQEVSRNLQAGNVYVAYESLNKGFAPYTTDIT